MATSKKQQHFDDDNTIWHTTYGDIKFKDVTHQHWSNIVHYGIANKNSRMIKTGVEQLLKRFAGEILPPTNYQPPKPKTETIITTEDGVKITNQTPKGKVLYVINYGSRNSVMVRNLQISGLVDSLNTKIFWSEEKRNEYYVLTTPILSIMDLVKLKRDKVDMQSLKSLTVGEVKAAARKKLGLK